MLRLLYYKMKKLKMDNNIENIIKVIGTYKYISKPIHTKSLFINL